jgi:DNA recombination protein RmuC
MEPTQITGIVIAIFALLLLSSLGVLVKRVLSILSARRDENVDLERKLAVETEKASRIPDLEQSLTEKSSLIDRLREEGVVSERNVATLRETLRQVEKQANEARNQLAQQFELLGEEIMKRHGESFTKQNKEQIDGVLTPLRDRLVEFQQSLEKVRIESVEERAKLTEHIRALSETSIKMTNETHGLTQALKGKAPIQGAWGEMVLQTILERSGLREGEEFFTQESYSDDNGSRLRPDVVVKLPGGRRVVIDAKVSLSAFEAYVNATNEQERSLHLSRHLDSLRNHIKALSEKEYARIADSRLDFVIMFVPIEGALAAAWHKDPEVSNFATTKNVAIATPTTLTIALKTIANVWQVELRNKNAADIADKAGKIYDKFVGFIEDMTVAGSRLKQAQESYSSAMSKLTTGKGNLLCRLQQLKAMGATTAKSLPEDMLESAKAETVFPSAIGPVSIHEPA